MNENIKIPDRYQEETTEVFTFFFRNIQNCSLEIFHIHPNSFIQNCYNFAANQSNADLVTFW